jgi:4-amino-4-deoxy-L-arabinose transferase-like glycosyltransferase
MRFEYINIIYVLLAVSFIGIIIKFRSKPDFLSICKKIILTFLPTEIILLTGFYFGANFNYLLKLSAGLYLMLAFIYLIFKFKKYENIKDLINEFKNEQKEYFLVKLIKDKFSYAIIILISFLYFVFGFYHISKFAAVDEPLWTDGRISKYWNNIKEGEFEKTNISDKPGITLTWISGIGLNWIDPRDYKSNQIAGEIINKVSNIEEMHYTFRTPILIFNFLMLLLIYALLKRLWNKEIAIISFMLMALSPILLGITRIVNPDALIWPFTTISLLSYFLYLKEEKNKYLYMAGIFLGFSILTKYIANIVYIYFLIIVFLEYILNSGKYASQNKYFKKSIADYLVLSFLSISVYYIFYPAAWIEIKYLLAGTIFSQAFKNFWYFFAAIFLFILIDAYLLKSKIITPILDFFTSFKTVIIKTAFAVFLFFILITIFNVWLDVKWFDYESIIASPKTAFRDAGFLGLFSANFYAMVFGIIPVALLAIIFLLSRNIFKKDTFSKKTIYNFYLVVFIIFYYLASSANLVSATVRYQILIYPLIFILAGAGIYELIKLTSKENEKFFYWSSLALIIFSIISLFFIKPFYFSYASSFLPQKYVLNLKDMGDGSYEAAQYLNQLDNAKNVTIWSDKKGVCLFFVGRCFVERDPENIEIFDYLVLSSGRESRTSRLISSRLVNGKLYSVRLDKLYADENAIYKLKIGNRPNNFVKIFSKDQINIIN